MTVLLEKLGRLRHEDTCASPTEDKLSDTADVPLDRNAKPDSSKPCPTVGPLRIHVPLLSEVAPFCSADDWSAPRAKTQEPSYGQNGDMALLTPRNHPWLRAVLSAVCSLKKTGVTDAGMKPLRTSRVIPDHRHRNPAAASKRDDRKPARIRRL
jgi:hypothetical protein